MKQLFLAISIAILSVGAAIGAAPSAMAAGSTCKDAYVFGIPAWYNHLPLSETAGGCEVGVPKDGLGQADIVKMAAIIGMNVVQALLVVAAYFALFYIMKGGFNYIYGSGSSESIQNAKNTIKNAVIGLIIAGMSAGIVNMVAGLIK